MYNLNVKKCHKNRLTIIGKLSKMFYDYIDDSNFHLFFHPLYKTDIVRKILGKDMELDVALDFVCNRKNRFDIKKSNPKFNFFEKDFSEFILCCKC